MTEPRIKPPDFDPACMGIDWCAKGGIYNGSSVLGISPDSAERSMQDAKEAGVWEWREEMMEKQEAMLRSQKVSGRWAVIAAVAGILAAVISAASLCLSVLHIV